MQAGRFFGFVIGGTLPAALATDWLVSAWDQNSGLLAVTPTTAAAETVAGGWVLDLLGLPAGSAVGFVTGGCMANMTCLAVGRHHVLSAAGWDVQAHGLQGAHDIADDPSVSFDQGRTSGHQRSRMSIGPHTEQDQIKARPGGCKSKLFPENLLVIACRLGWGIFTVHPEDL